MRDEELREYLAEVLKIGNPVEIEQAKSLIYARAKEPKVDFSGLTLPEDLNLAGYSLQKANFFGCTARGIILDRADLAGANFYQAYLPGASLRETILDGCCFLDASLEFSHLERSKGNHTTFDLAGLFQANLSWTEFKESWFRLTSFNQANINLAVFQGCDLSQARLSGAIASASSFAGSNMTGANLIGAVFEKGTSFNGTNLKDIQYFNPGIQVDPPEVVRAAIFREVSGQPLNVPDDLSDRFVFLPAIKVAL